MAQSLPKITPPMADPGTYRPFYRNRAITAGTSIENQAGTGSETLDAGGTGSTAVNARGWWHWMNAYLGQRLRLDRNAGISGSKTAAQLAALPAEIAAYPNADWLFIGGPVNDVAGDDSTATITANLTAMYDLAKAAGMRVVQLTCAPSSFYSTTARRTVLSEVNDWIRDVPATRGDDVIVVDVWRLLADPATGSPATGMAVDGIHPSPQGAERMGRAVADVVSGFIAKRPPRIVGLLDPKNVIGNPHLASGTGWSLLNASGRAVAYAAADDRGSSKATITATGVADNLETAISYVEAVGGGRYAAGDVVQLSARIKWSGLVPRNLISSPCIPFLRIMPRLADSSFPDAKAFAMAVASGEVPAGGGFPASGDAVFITSRVTLPASIANLYVAVGWQGASDGVFEISDVSIRKGA